MPMYGWPCMKMYCVVMHEPGFIGSKQSFITDVITSYASIGGKVGQEVESMSRLQK